MRKDSNIRRCSGIRIGRGHGLALCGALAAGLGLSASVVRASLAKFDDPAELDGGDAIVLRLFDLEGNAPIPAPSPESTMVAYDNISSFSSQTEVVGSASGGVTKMLADDIASPLGAGGRVQSFRFAIANPSSSPIAFRPRPRFFDNDGTAASPGTLIAGIGFNVITLPANTAAVLGSGTTPGGWFNVPADGTFWAGMAFDNFFTSTSNATLGLLAVGLYDPPAVGSSNSNVMFRSTASSTLSSSPAGSSFNLGAFPANAGWAFTVPEPATLGLLAGVSLLMLGRKR